MSSPALGTWTFSHEELHVPRKPTGAIKDPEFRRERARKAGQASHSTDTLIARLVQRAPELTDAQRAELTRLAELAGSDGGR